MTGVTGPGKVQTRCLAVQSRVKSPAGKASWKKWHLKCTSSAWIFTCEQGSFQAEGSFVQRGEGWKAGGGAGYKEISRAGSPRLEKQMTSSLNARGWWTMGAIGGSGAEEGAT